MFISQICLFFLVNRLEATQILYLKNIGLKRGRKVWRPLTRMKDEEFHERFIVFSCQRPEGPEPRMWIAVVASCIDDPTNGVGGWHL